MPARRVILRQNGGGKSAVYAVRAYKKCHSVCEVNSPGGSSRERRYKQVDSDVKKQFALLLIEQVFRRQVNVVNLDARHAAVVNRAVA